MADEKKNDEDTEPIAPPPVAHHEPNDYLPIASERLSQVRYVFIVQIEDGVASARSRSCLEYADAVLMAWPDVDAEDLRPVDQIDMAAMAEAEQQIERHIAAFRLAERADQTDEMGDELVKIADAAAIIRRAYQPDVQIPTLDEISRVVGEEWSEEMGSLDATELENSEELRHDVEIANQNGPSGNIPSARELQEKREHHRREEKRQQQRQQSMDQAHADHLKAQQEQPADSGMTPTYGSDSADNDAGARSDDTDAQH
jgi:hypothetical protein